MTIARAGAPAAGRAPLRAGLSQAGPLAAAGVAANAGSVVVTVVLARLLPGPGYGALNQLTGLFFVMSTPGSAVLVAVVRRLARWEPRDGDAAAWAGRLRRRALWALAGFTAAASAAGPLLAAALGRGHDQAGVDAIVVAGAVWVYLCVDRGILQAGRAYRALSTNLVSEGGLRTALMLLAGAAGLGVVGVAGAVLVAEVVTAVQARQLAERAWKRLPPAPLPPAPLLPAPLPGVGERGGLDGGGLDGGGLEGWTRSAAADVLGAIVALAAVAVLQNVDVIVVGREGPGSAGAYAAVSVSAKVLVFLAMVVGGYLLPEAALRWRSGAHALHQLLVSLTLVAGPAAVLLAVAAAAPRRFLALFFSDRYVAAEGAFLPLAVAMALLSVVVLVTMYLLAVGDRWVVGLLVAGAAAAAAATAGAHGAPRATALADLAAEMVLTTLVVGELVRVHRRRN